MDFGFFDKDLLNRSKNPLKVRFFPTKFRPFTVGMPSLSKVSNGPHQLAKHNGSEKRLLERKSLMVMNT